MGGAVAGTFVGDGVICVVGAGASVVDCTTGSNTTLPELDFAQQNIGRPLLSRRQMLLVNSTTKYRFATIKHI